MKSIVIYYSNTSHTAEVARLIAEEIGCETEAIRVKEPYGDYLNDRSKIETSAKRYPEIFDLKHNLGEYDTIFLGTPTWWVSPSGPVSALCEKGAFKGKKVYPFITTGFDVEGVEAKLKEELIGSEVEKALIVPYDNAFIGIDKHIVTAYADQAKAD